MKKTMVLTLAILLSGLLATAAMAAGEENALIPPASSQGKAAMKGKTLEHGPVSKDQLDLMKKRDNAIKQKEKAMKMRLKKIKAADKGVVGEELPVPPKK